ncbi:ArsR/SmtB family transcription factor [Curtobacterium herbarum]|uniref:Metalloregulator ArsR/SmtB family transcription factor n=1 Tax=Curtobacterium herbarum TaxID=150122 RepID=A0ABP4K4M5_9MICO|nr:metalloregulator ArsR/SmtB family transcription factor [Curtobacterium herbarum]MBM7476893.1 DNA-binding transcriptional ArsR family regulator [Curtobacterium herbarum]MCS6545096.1 helix-turn-helix domain-containing protein [Curtobacterium herbarum]
MTVLKGRDAVNGEADMSRAELVDALKALANPTRLQIMEWLRDPEGQFADYDPIADRVEVGICASHIQDRTGLSQSTISSYMGTLERAGLVTSTRIGKWTHYRRNEALLRRVAEAVSPSDLARA